MFQGKRIFFSLTVLGAKLFISAMSMAITSVPGNGKVTFSRELREEISHWRFVDLWPGFLPRRDEKHISLSLSADASGHGWGCVTHLSSGDSSFGDYWIEIEHFK